jgi:hypothetical protein
MDSENSDYDIVPINNSCTNTINSSVIVSSPGSQTSNTNQNISNINTQHEVNSQYDNVDNINVQHLYSGGKKLKNSLVFNIKFRNKIINIESSSEKKAIRIFLKNKNYKKDHILEIIYKNKNSIYLIKGNNNNKINKINKFKKIN